jgi:uncharacterized RDD family membrane protein YckC
MIPSTRYHPLWFALLAFVGLSLAVRAQEPPATTAQTPDDRPSAEAPAAAPAAVPAPPDAADGTRSESARKRAAARRTGRGDHTLVNVFADSTLARGESAEAVVSIFGSSTADGDVRDAVVSVFGDSRVTGEVGDAVVAVLGNVYVNSRVRGDVVAVLGDIELGPNAEVEGQLVCVLGTVTRSADAILGRGIQSFGFGRSLSHMEGLMAWIHRCLFYGRPLAFGPNLGWAWAVAGAFLALYVLLALVFRGGIEKCMQTLAVRPGASVLTSFLTVLISPVAMFLLIVTGIGILLVPLVGSALFLASFFGVAAVLAWLGAKFTRIFGDGPLSHPAFGVLIAGILVLGLYTVPVLGFITFKFLGWLGTGVVIFTLLQAMKQEPPAPAVAGSGAAVPMSAAGVAAENPGGSVGDPAGALSPPVMPPPAPPPISAATLPRAGFWIRMAALMLDLVVLGIIAGVLTGGGKLALLGVGVYAAVLWRLKGTTIGGVICGLKVVRLDERPIDWGTAIVRALGCFLSLAVVGLGFIWVAIDDQRQSWHDKIAGTTVVRVPKGTSLI